MDNFERKYGIKTNERVKEYHRSRKMFCIYKDKIYIAPSLLPHSHADWFENQGWIKKENDEKMQEIIRGIVDSNGNISFYIGYDFIINENVEEVFFSYLGELIKRLKLDENAEVYGGWIKEKDVPRKRYGKIKNLYTQ